MLFRLVKRFDRASAHRNYAERDTDIAIMSVCLSVRLSHAGIELKQGIVLKLLNC